MSNICPPCCSFHRYMALCNTALTPCWKKNRAESMPFPNQLAGDYLNSFYSILHQSCRFFVNLQKLWDEPLKWLCEQPGENPPAPSQSSACVHGPWLDLDLLGLKLKVGPVALAARERFLLDKGPLSSPVHHRAVLSWWGWFTWTAFLLGRGGQETVMLGIYFDTQPNSH